MDEAQAAGGTATAGLGRRRLWRWLGRGGLAAAVVLCGAMGWSGWLYVSGNFHAVIEGQLYRSAQPRPGDLAYHAYREGIRSVLNLRGARPGRPWYDAEIAESQYLGLVHADFEMKAGERLSHERAEELLALLHRLPQPVLIHCRAGSDRTGLVSALYLASVAGSDEWTAEMQLSFLYGHVALPIVSAGWAMDATWEGLEPRLGFPDS